MKTLFLIPLFMITYSAFSQEKAGLSKEIIALETAALERWNNGDVYGYLELYAEDIVYFDPYLDKRIDGLKELTELYKPWQGKIKVSEYEIINPLVQAVDNMAVLTFNLRSVEGSNIHRWNCTEVFRKNNGKWKIIQTHWSLTKPDLK